MRQQNNGRRRQNRGSNRRNFNNGNLNGNINKNTVIDSSGPCLLYTSPSPRD